MRFKIVLVVCVWLFAPESLAVLGQREASVTADQSKLNLVRPSTASAPLYTIHESTNALYDVKEFVSSSGYVFAVTWSGTIQPDLSLLLGEHYAEYKAADDKRDRKYARTPTEVDTSTAVIKTLIRMRDARGLAYLPALLPTGVNPEDLR